MAANWYRLNSNGTLARLRSVYRLNSNGTLVRLESMYRVNSNGTLVKVFSGLGFPSTVFPYPELNFKWPDGYENIDSPINGSKMFATRGKWKEDPLEFRIRIQERAPGGTWDAVYDFTKTYEEYLDSDSSDRFPSNANDASRPIISKARTRAGYEFRLRIDATNADDLTDFYVTSPIMPRMDFRISTFDATDITNDGATFSWFLSPLVNDGLTDPTADIHSQTLRVYDEFSTLVKTISVPVGTTIYELSDPLIESEKTYTIELEVIGKDGHATTETPTAEYSSVDITTVALKPEIVTAPTFTLQSGEANKTGSVYRLTSGTWTGNPTEFRYTIERNDFGGTVIAYYPSASGYTTDTYYDHTFLNATGTTVSGSVIAFNGVASDPVYASQTVGPITQLKYTVTYDGNGGTPARSSDEVIPGDSVSLPSASRSGYTFDGWYTATSGGTFLGNTNTTYTPTGNITIYARWTAITYTVTWNANGGSVSPTSSSGTFGQVITAPTPTRAGYTFVYWRNPATGDMLYNINAGQSWTINGDITFTAVWSINQYTVTFDEQGGSNVTDQTVNYNSAISLPSTSRSGYTFDGWYTASSGGTFLGFAGTSYTVTNNITIYARWSVITYTVTWNANGGSVSPTSSSGVLGATVTAPTPTRAGYTFVYWRNPATGDMLYNINAGASWTINGSITFTAVWQINQYTVTYNANGGSVSPSSDTVNAGSSVTLPSPSRSGYTLNGWYTASSGGTFLGNPGTSYTPSSSITIYAQWSAVTYTVTWNANGGSVSPTSNSGIYGQTITAPTPTRSGYTFVYWRNPSSGDILYTLNAGASWTINGSITFYAVWTINQYTVTYNANGGTVSPTSATVNAGSSVTLPTPTRSGYTFNGWYDSAGGGNLIGNAGASYTPTSSITIYARWTGTQYTVTWNANGGTVTPASSSGVSGTVVTSPTPSRSGYTFLYWRDTTSVFSYIYQINPGGTWTITSNITFYAWWQVNTVNPFFPPFFPPSFTPFFPPFFPPTFGANPFFPPAFPPYFTPAWGSDYRLKENIDYYSVEDSANIISDIEVVGQQHDIIDEEEK